MISDAYIYQKIGQPQEFGEERALITLMNPSIMMKVPKPSMQINRITSITLTTILEGS